MDIMKIINKAKDIILNPTGTLKKLKDEKVTKKDIIIYLGIVGFPSFIGILLGYGFVGYGYGEFFAAAFVRAILYYILAIGGIIVFGYIFNALAQNFKTKQNLMQAVKLVSYSSTPWLIAGIFFIFPAAGLIALLAGLYGLYILYIGIPILMGTPKDQQLTYLIFGIIVYIIVMAIVSWITNWIWFSMWWGATGGPYWGPYF